ncbi:helix-turn-helix transcriptional regulator [Chitinivorax sp. PXF-14]|uniref:helix-turn-helix domain-containing protein n=1 Tax=Chitinivorax sp. PXF-14 TaxID=3230488 RepID=UPI003467935C
MDDENGADLQHPSSGDELGRLRMELGARIKKVRTDIAKVSRDAFARELGVAISTAQRWEDGVREPDGTMLGKLARRYEVRLDWLLYGEGAMQISDKGAEQAPTMDYEALRHIIITLERYQNEHDLAATPEKKAMLIEHIHKNYGSLKGVLDTFVEGVMKAAA